MSYNNVKKYSGTIFRSYCLSQQDQSWNDFYIYVKNQQLFWDCPHTGGYYARQTRIVDSWVQTILFLRYNTTSLPISIHDTNLLSLFNADCLIYNKHTGYVLFARHYSTGNSWSMQLKTCEMSSFSLAFWLVPCTVVLVMWLHVAKMIIFVSVHLPAFPRLGQKHKQ